MPCHHLTIINDNHWFNHHHHINQDKTSDNPDKQTDSSQTSTTILGFTSLYESVHDSDIPTQVVFLRRSLYVYLLVLLYCHCIVQCAECVYQKQNLPSVANEKPPLEFCKSQNLFRNDPVALSLETGLRSLPESSSRCSLSSSISCNSYVEMHWLIAPSLLFLSAILFN